MDYLIQYPVPEWITITFLLTIPAPILLTMFLAKSAFPVPISRRVFYTAGIFFSIYLVYVIVLGTTGQFETALFPPKVLLFTTFPFAFFQFLYVAKTKWYRIFIENVTLDRLVWVHIFRLIGFFFVLLAYYDTLPQWFGYIAGIGDVLTALTALWVAKLVAKRNSNALKITWIWNTFGLADILFTAVSANVLTKLSIDKGIMGVDTLAMFPFYLIPALAPPLIIFLHYSTYLKLKKQVKVFS